MENVKFKNLVHTQACIKAFELQHYIAPPFQDNLSFNYLSPRDSTASVWKPPEFEKQTQLLSACIRWTRCDRRQYRLFGKATLLVFYKPYQPHDPNSVYYVGQFSGGVNTLDYFLSSLQQNKDSLNSLNSQYRILIQQYDARIRVLYHTLKEKKLLREPDILFHHGLWYSRVSRRRAVM